jgi:sugar/nucleoside kinase (ribokinase family)
MYDVITIGGATRDVFFRTSQGRIISTPFHPTQQKLLAFEYGAKITPDKAYFSFGGGGANSASCFARLGLKVACCICIGKERTGDALLENLKKNKVDTSFVIRDPKLHTALSVMLSVPSGEKVVFRGIGADSNLNIKNWNRVTKTKWFYVTSLREKSAKLLDKIAKVTNKGKVKLAFNPGIEQIKKGYKDLKTILKTTSILILNKDEAIELVLSKNKNVRYNNVKQLLKNLKSWGPEIVVITCGRRGAYAIGDKKIYYQKAYKVKTVDSAGAGDAFGSTFVFGIIKRLDIEKSLKIAAKNAASCVSKLGAQEGLLSFKELIK